MSNFHSVERDSFRQCIRIGIMFVLLCVGILLQTATLVDAGAMKTRAKQQRSFWNFSFAGNKNKAGTSSQAQQQQQQQQTSVSFRSQQQFQPLQTQPQQPQWNVPVAKGGTTQQRPWKINRPLAVVAGPTGTGKSDVGVEMAKEFNGEVISADSMQIYNDLRIASNTITVEERQNVPHHLLEYFPSTTIGYSSDNWARDALDAIKGIWRRGKLPIIAGGSESYISTLLDLAYKKERLDRANVLLLYLDPSRKELMHFQRLDERVEKFKTMGLVKENDDFFNKYGNTNKLIDGFRGPVQSIGFREFMVYLLLNKAERETEQGKKMLEESFEMQKIANRQYARMQRIRFEKRLLPYMHLKYVLEVSSKETFYDQVVPAAISIVRQYLYHQQ